MTLGEKIQHYRKRDGLSQEELARLLVVSRQTVSLWETGQTYPTIDNLIRLREIFHVSIDELLTGEAVGTESANAENAKKSESCEGEASVSEVPNNTAHGMPTVRGIVSVFLIVLSILSACISGPLVLILRTVLSRLFPFAVSSLLPLAFILLIAPVAPIASLIFGYSLRTRGYHGRKNIVVGYIILAILCFFALILFFSGIAIGALPKIPVSSEVVFDYIIP